MTCREVIEFLMNYLDDELSPEVRIEFDRHLAVCASCTAYLNSYRQTVALSKSGLLEEARSNSTELPKELVEAIQSTLRNS
jgi:anti-sigma factor RsiW